MHMFLLHIIPLRLPDVDLCLLRVVFPLKMSLLFLSNTRKINWKAKVCHYSKVFCTLLQFKYDT